MITVNGLCAGGMVGVGKCVDECSVDGGDGERLLSKLPFLFLTEEAVTTEAGISQPSPKMPTLSFGGGSHPRVPSRGALIGRVEQEGGKTGWINIERPVTILKAVISSA